MILNHYSLRGCLKRPVTDEDEFAWCKRPRDFYGRIPKGKAPWGYVITIPVPMYAIDLKHVNGYIVRTKKDHNILLLQVVNVGKQKYPKYRIISTIQLCGSKKSWIINVRNLRKPLLRKKWGIY